MRLFTAVADAGGFALAARRLGLSPPAVTRAIAALEARIATRLLHRTTRAVRLTDAGERFLVDCRRILAEVEDAEAAAAGSHAGLRGPIAVTASVLFGRLHVAPLVLAFLGRHPRVTMRTLFVDGVVPLVEEGIDVAVRIGHLADSSLTAVRVGSVRRVVCAAPGYLAVRGAPATPADLEAHDLVGFTGLGLEREWRFPHQAVPVSPRLVTNQPDVAVAAACAGHGLSMLLSYMIATEVAAGSLVSVLRDWEPPPLPVHVVHHAGRSTSARVRTFVDHAVEALRANPALA